ncbi:uncharacterized protein LOC121726410 [Aricia agestis]|uniref:uncharacterized protein LOC121726410 n=1 Tax=Aricia agestis TaxID=91739 RepID=UPI001C208828|nr:uncharacterized protein LOC121726410 [Aricia agestis]
MFAVIFLCLLSLSYAIPATLEGTVVDFTDPKIKGHLAALAHMGASCMIKAQPPRADVEAYLTNTPAQTYRGQCFATCMLESSDVIDRGQVNREILIKLASVINGRNSYVVRKLKEVSRRCSMIVTSDDFKDRCVFGAMYNNCLNKNMKEFRFPEEIAAEVLKVLPFHLVTTKRTPYK